MHLRPPNLDDRRFQDLVDEAKRRIPRYCPQWTDHNVSDPGITLIELFAFMTEQYLFRLNQALDRHYLTYLDLIGVRLAPAQPARGDVTFRCAAAPTADRRIIIPAWTEVATTRTETEAAVVFTTDHDAEIVPPTLRWTLISADGEEYLDQPALRGDSDESAAGPRDIWPTLGASPTSAPHFYLGFDEDLSAHTLAVDIDCEERGLGIQPRQPPWRWEVWRGAESGWQPVMVDRDTTDGLSVSGSVRLHLPYGCQPSRVAGFNAGAWLRCAPRFDLAPGQRPYARSPRVGRVESYTIGITVPVTHAVPVYDEVVGVSDGQPAQRFVLQHANVLALEGPDEVIEVETEAGDWAVWTPVADFGDSTPDDHHYTFDPVLGEIEFGPAVRQRTGAEPQFGAIPPRGAQIRVRRYRLGGGVQGNVAAGLVTVIKSTAPYLEAVVNRYSLTGGAEVQTLDDARLRGPKRLRTRFRAVTADDYETLASEVEGVGRVRCLQPGPAESSGLPPGTVSLLVIPGAPRLDGAELDRHITFHDSIHRLGEDEHEQAVAELRRRLSLPPATGERLREYLDDRRLLTTRLDIREPRYVWVIVEAQVHVEPRAEPERVRRDVKAELYRFIHPLQGGVEGAGWPFGEPLTIDRVYARVLRVPGVAYASGVKLFTFDLARREIGPEVQVLSIPADSVVVSYWHNVDIV